MSGQMEFVWNDEENSRCDGSAMQMLAHIKQGPKTNAELSALGFLRYGANVGTLRERGYDIRKRKGKSRGEWVYSYFGYKARVKCPPSMQSRYYSSSHWRTKRLERLNLDGFKCCHCRATTSLQVHHWTYDLFEEDIEDLVTLCANCHERVHAYSQVRISFPDYIDREHLERLKGIK